MARIICCVLIVVFCILVYLYVSDILYIPSRACHHYPGDEHSEGFTFQDKLKRIEDPYRIFSFLEDNNYRLWDKVGTRLDYSEKFWECKSFACDFRKKYTDIVISCGYNTKHLDTVSALENEFIDVYKKIVIFKKAGDERWEKLGAFVDELGKITERMRRFLADLSIEIVDDFDGASDETSPKDELYAKLEAKIAELGDTEDGKIGLDILDIHTTWEDAMETGAIDEFSETKTMLKNLINGYFEMLEEKRDKETFLSQLDKAKQNVSILDELAKTRVKSQSESSGENLELDSWHTVLKNALNQEQLKI